jgi:hypothetical protein
MTVTPIFPDVHHYEIPAELQGRDMVTYQEIAATATTVRLPSTERKSDEPRGNGGR